MTQQIEDHLPVILHTAHHYIEQARPFGMGFDDLVQIGLIAVNKALLNFDETRGVKFSASFITRNAIVDELRKQSRKNCLLSAPDNTLARKLRRIRELYYQRTGWELSYEQLSKLTGLTVAKITNLLSHRVESIITDENGDECNIFDMIIEARPSIRLALIERVRRCVNHLRVPAKEKEILKMYFGIGYPKRFTLQQIADAFGYANKSSVYHCINKLSRKLKWSSTLKQLAHS